MIYLGPWTQYAKPIDRVRQLGPRTQSIAAAFYETILQVDTFYTLIRSILKARFWRLPLKRENVHATYFSARRSL